MTAKGNDDNDDMQCPSFLSRMTAKNKQQQMLSIAFLNRSFEHHKDC